MMPEKVTMQADPQGDPLVAAGFSDVVAARFMDSKSAHGAIADLKLAGFRGDKIAVAFSAEGKQAHWDEFQPLKPAQGGLPKDCYSFVWRLRRGFQQDLHHRGPEVLADGSGKSLAEGAVASHCEVDLQETLRAMGVAEERIKLLDRILGPKGVLILVDSGDRWREVKSILERNAGQIRTDSATERAPSSAR